MLSARPSSLPDQCRRRRSVLPLAVRARRMAMPSRGRHEFRTDRVGDQIAKDPIDLGPRRVVQGPAADSIDRPELLRTPRAPESYRDALIEHPANCQVNDALAVALAGEPVE